MLAKIYIYDGSFEGLLSVFRELILDKLEPINIIQELSYKPSLFNDVIFINCANQKDLSDFCIYIQQKLSNKAFKAILLCYLSELKGFEMLLYKYLTIVLKKGLREIHNLSNPVIFEINKICTKVMRECHRFYGFLRFRLVEGNIYYAPFEPEHNIISVTTPHFAKRLKNQDWIIHDKKRNIAIGYNAETREMKQVLIDTNKIVLTNFEKTIQELWSIHFKYISIENRINHKLQMNFMPQKYWKYLLEKNN